MAPEEYELGKEDHKCAFEILRQSGRWTPSQIKKMMREPRGLRDDFASAALTGILANPHSMKSNGRFDFDDVASAAFHVASKMMQRREL